MDLAVLELLIGDTDSLPEHFVGLLIIGIKFMSKPLPRLNFRLFYYLGCGRSSPTHL